MKTNTLYHKRKMSGNMKNGSLGEKRNINGTIIGQKRAASRSRSPSFAKGRKSGKTSLFLAKFRKNVLSHLELPGR